MENYRPISLLCVIAKVMERCIYNHLVDHIRKMISLAQHGFQRGKSCTGQLLSVLHRISKNLNSGKQTDILYFDITKAFDTVDHNLLLNKLSIRTYGQSFTIVQKLLDRAPTTCTTQRCHIRYSSYFFRCSSRINTWTPSLLDLRK